MHTYTVTYLDDEDIRTLEQCGGISVEAKDAEGMDRRVGKYLTAMAEQRHNSLGHYLSGTTLLLAARDEIAPLANPEYWTDLVGSGGEGSPAANRGLVDAQAVTANAAGLAESFRRQIIDIDRALHVMATGLTLTYEPDPEEDRDSDMDGTFDRWMQREHLRQQLLQRLTGPPAVDD